MLEPEAWVPGLLWPPECEIRSSFNPDLALLLGLRLSPGVQSG